MKSRGSSFDYIDGKLNINVDSKCNSSNEAKTLKLGRPLFENKKYLSTTIEIEFPHS